MIRWGCLLLGIASIVLGVVGYEMHPPVATEAHEVSVDEAIALVAGHDRVPIDLDAALDVEHKLYAALTERPHFTLESTVLTYDVEASAVSAEALEVHLGNRVRFQADLARGSSSLATVSPRSLGEDRLHGERILAPVTGTEGSVWVVSPFFTTSDPDRARWRLRTTFEGVVSRLRDIGENLASYRIEYDFDAIRRVAADELGIPIDDRTLLVDTANDTAASGLYRLHVAGSNGALWVTPFYEQNELPAWARTGPIRGLMWGWDADGDFDADLAAVSGLPVPARYGVIHHDETAEEVNTKTTFGLKLFTGLGAVFIAFSAVAFLVKRWRH
jgi:hypothetical protein